MNRMNRSGRVSLPLIILVVVAVAAVAIFLLAGESPSGVASKFLIALARKDAKEVAALSYMGPIDEAEKVKRWQKTLEATKYWRFNYAITDTSQQDANNATVRMKWIKAADQGGAFEEKYELPMVKKDGNWKVDVRAISREMYPSLPQ
jgi:hypothetical protein